MVASVAMAVAMSSVSVGLEESGADRFFARIGIGGGYAQSASTELDTRVFGPVGEITVDLGTGIREGVLVLVSGSVAQVVQADARVEDVESGADVSAAFFGLGVGLQFALPNAWYVAGALQWTRQDLQLGGVDFANGENGGSLVLSGGRDWWVHPNWGLGFAVIARYGQIDDVGSRWNPAVATLNLNASYRVQ